ncbi:hypothetical protein CMT41_15050 [Colwellia sp. MT41]|uniref:DUF4097 domain-containing protein n=1 Tax=Colwellia marinimaniae TaxID=1513592 RepID=A0ABQ0MQZ9_9GAMM|nr:MULTISPECIES: DUF4097 family beta strand repeat-containing protein [Colwellia]ALO35894.1 hypothetical protein CMT41_15050 [Colwellia sp. MT41]GAW94612.1 hypothetical protein MTCD1_00208 [Colwellia marinimaniae]
MNRLSRKVQQCANIITMATCLLFSSQLLAATEIAQSLPSETVTNVAISNHGGFITVIGWDKDKISVSGTLDDDAEKLIFEQKGAQVIIEVEYPRMDNWRADGSKIIVFMPKNIRMKSSSISSEIHVSNLHGGVEVNTVSGDILAKNLTQSVELNSISGNINSHNLAGKVSLAAVSGDIQDNNSTGRLEIRSVSGEVVINSQAKEVFFNNVSGNSELNLAEVIELRIRTVSGDIQATLTLVEKALLKASTVSGDLTFTFQKGVDADFSLKSSVGGDIDNNITKEKTEHAEYGPGAKLNFQTLNGSALVRVSTVSGNIEVSSK